MLSASPGSRYLRRSRVHPPPSWPGQPWPPRCPPSSHHRGGVPAKRPGGCGRKRGPRAGTRGSRSRGRAACCGGLAWRPGASPDSAAVWELWRAGRTPPSWQGLSHRDAPARWGLAPATFLPAYLGPREGLPGLQGWCLRGKGGWTPSPGQPPPSSSLPVLHRAPSPTTDPSPAHTPPLFKSSRAPQAGSAQSPALLSEISSLSSEIP